MLDLIFGHLIREDQLNFARTSKRMNQIFSCKRNLSKFEFTLDFDNNELPSLQRQYSFVSFKNLSSPENSERQDAMNAIVAAVGPHIRKLKLIHGNVTENFLSKILRYCPNVESISFKKVFIKHSEVIRELSFEKLKSLSIDEETSAEELSRVLSSVTTLNSIKYYKSASDDDEEEDESTENPERSFAITEIMMRQRNLKHLQISAGTVFESIVQPFPFQLNKLLLLMPSMSRLQMRNMKKLVVKQTELEEVTLNVHVESQSYKFNKALQHIMQSSKLKILQIVFYHSSMSKFYRGCKIVNPSVENLYLSVRKMDYSYHRFIQSNTNMFPNLKKLSISFDPDWTEKDKTSAKTFAPFNDLKMMETIVLENFATNLMTKLELKQLKTLRLDSLNQFNRDQFEVFLRKNPSIETLNVKLGYGCCKHSAIPLVESAVMHLPRIKEINVCVNGQTIPETMMDDLHEFISEGTSPLQYLRICGNVLEFNASNTAVSI